MTKPIESFSSYSAVSLLKEASKSLHPFGVVDFGHDITFGKGNIAVLSSNESFLKYIYKERMPAVFTSNNGRDLAPGVYFKKILETKSEYYDKILKKITKNFNFNHLIHIVEHEDSYQNLYSFHFQCSENDFLHWTINNLFLLQNFIENYKHLARDFLIAAKEPENQFFLPYDDNRSTSKKQITVQKEKMNTLCVRHKDTLQSIYLSPQQSRCLELLMSGKTPKQIAFEMHLSYRTIENYILHIRLLLGCDSTRELILRYYQQLI